MGGANRTPFETPGYRFESIFGHALCAAHSQSSLIHILVHQLELKFLCTWFQILGKVLTLYR